MPFLFLVTPQQEVPRWRQQQLYRHHENAVVSSEYTRLSELQLPQKVRVLLVSGTYRS